MFDRSRPRRRLAAEQSGTVIILFALLLVPIAGLMAGAIDFARQTAVQRQMQESLDAASLAVAKYIHANWNGDPAELAAVQEEARAAGIQMFLANFTPTAGVSAPPPRFTFNGDRVGATADVDFPASFLGMVGINRLGAAGYAEAVIPGAMDAEIVLVLDYSGSMRDNDKYKRMAAAAKLFVQKVKDSKAERTLVGLVPFSDFVRTKIDGRYVRDVVPVWHSKLLEICISNRSYPYSTMDETPNQSDAGSKWPGVSLPSAATLTKESLSSGVNFFRSNNSGDSLRELKLGDITDNCNKMAARKLSVLDLTNDYRSLLKALDDMETLMYTNIALGAEVGWHLLSSNEPFTRGAIESDETVKKVLILLTDGMQTVPAEGPSGNSIAGANEAIAEVCANMATAAIEVYTIAYDLEDAFTRSLLSDCASEPSHYFEPSVSSDLSAVFEQIYDDIAESVRLAR